MANEAKKDDDDVNWSFDRRKRQGSAEAQHPHLCFT